MTHTPSRLPVGWTYLRLMLTGSLDVLVSCTEPRHPCCATSHVTTPTALLHTSKPCWQGAHSAAERQCTFQICKFPVMLCVTICIRYCLITVASLVVEYDGVHLVSGNAGCSGRIHSSLTVAKIGSSGGSK